MNRTEHTQRTDINKLFRYHVQLAKSINEIFRLQIIHPVEFPFIGALGYPGTMDDIIKLIIRSFVSGKLGTQFIGMCKVQFKDMYFAVSQILPATA